MPAREDEARKSIVWIREVARANLALSREGQRTRLAAPVVRKAAREIALILNIHPLGAAPGSGNVAKFAPSPSPLSNSFHHEAAHTGQPDDALTDVAKAVPFATPKALCK